MQRRKTYFELNKRAFMKSSEGLPSSEYAFGDGKLSMVIERNGGINEMQYILEENIGKPLLRPNRCPLPILSREGGVPENHPPGMYYGPPVRFISTHNNGPNIYHYPEKFVLAPFGLEGLSNQYDHQYGYRFALRSPETVFYFSDENPLRQDLVIMVLKNGLCPGQWSSDYWVDKGDSDLLKNRDYDAYKQIFLQTAAWTDFKPDDESGILYAGGIISYRGRERELFFGIAADDKPVFRQINNGWLIINAWDKSKETLQHAYIVIAESMDELLQRVAALRTNPEQPWEEQTKRYNSLAKKIPRFRFPAYRDAEEFCHNLPLFNEAMTFDREEKTEAFRAAICNYGYYPAGDTTLSARGFAVYNQHTVAERLLRYSRQVITPDNMWIVAAHDCAAATRDYKFLTEVFPDIEKVMQERISACDERGMYACESCGADDPKQIGIEGAVTTPDGIGWWYNACRLTENTSRTLGKPALAEELRKISDRIEKHFFSTFYDPKTGFLTGAVDWATGKQNGYFQNVVTAAMEGLFGPHLLREKLEDIAAFVRNQLAHPYMRTAVPFWDNSSEMWTSCIMQHHAFHEGETLRFGRQDEELFRQFSCVMHLFGKFKTAIETVNLTDIPANYCQERRWQAFAGRAWYNFILQSVVGVERDRGGITYRPAGVPVDAEITGWKQGNITWNIAVSGAGKWVKSMKIDGKEMEGSYKTPSSVFMKAGRHSVEITRGKISPKLPVLVRAPHVDIEAVDCGRKGIEILFEGNVRTPIWLYTPAKMKITLDGRTVNPEQFGSGGLVSVDVLVEKKAILKAELA